MIEGERQAGMGVEVTPEMIEAGVSALREWIPPDQDRYSGDDGRAVRDAFLAMHALMRGECFIMCSSDAYDGKCPACGHTFTLADLKRMAVGDGWQRYLRIDGADGSAQVVSFDEYNPASVGLPIFESSDPQSKQDRAS